MTTNTIQTSFSAGEVAPGLWGRVDLAKYRTGLARCRNAYVEYKGGVSNRPGSRFVGRLLSDDEVGQLIPFQFNTEQTYILELSDERLRVIKDGAYVLDSAYTRTVAAVTQGATTVIRTSTNHGLSTGDYITIYDADVAWLNDTWLVTVIDADEFTLETVLGNNVNSSEFATWASGGTVSRPYSVAAPWTAADLQLLKYDQSADVMTIVHPSYPIYDVSRLADDNWTISAVSTVASIAAPTGVGLAISGAGTAYYGYAVTAVDANGQESLASAMAYINGVNITSTAGTVVVEWSPVTSAAYYNVYRAQIANASDVPTGASLGFLGVAFGVSLKDSNIVPDFTKSPPLRYDPFAPGQVISITITNGGAGYAVHGTTIGFSGGGGTGAAATPVVTGSGVVVAAIITNPGSGYTSAPSVTITGAGAGATATSSIGPVSGTYPSVCTYFQQRKWYAASTSNPETIWASRPGAYKNFDKSVPTVDNDSLQLTLASLQVNAIKWLVPMPGGLVVLTSGGAWQISGGGNNEAITPAKATATAQAYSGCSDVKPLVINYDILYVQGGSLVRALAYNFFVNIYTGVDLTLLSSQLFDGYTLTRWAWAEKPHRMVWAVRDDGVLLSCTYVKDQELAGWSRHDTQGLYESVATIQEGNDNAVYTIVRRYVGGQWYRFVERMAQRQFPNIAALPAGSNTGVEDAWFVDAGLDYPLVYPAAGAVLSGTSGQVTLTADASVFTGDEEGYVLRFGGGIGTVATYVSATTLIVNLTLDVYETIPNDTSVPLPQDEGEWSLTPPVTAVGGLWHLEGKTVKILADGSVQPAQTVSNGTITLAHAASRVIVGLGYQTQLQTLDLEGGQGTIQGRFKQIPMVTLKYENTRGVKVGPDFNNLTEIKLRNAAVPMGSAIPLQTGTHVMTSASYWSLEGRICIQQDDPLPMTILAIVPSVNIGSDPE